jgi:RNA polymerase sigma-70 factor (ECF subfamily)
MFVWPRKKFEPVPVADDADLVRRLRRGDEAAFEELFDATFEPLYRFASIRVGRDHELARELAQATICKGFEKLDTYRGEAPIFSWLCAICRFEITAHYRRLKREPPTLSLPEESRESLGVLDSLGRDHDDPEKQALRREVERLVHLAVDHLPRRYALAHEWRYAEQLGVPEIASRLAISYKAAESLLSRARQAFKDGFAGVSARNDADVLDSERAR